MGGRALRQRFAIPFLDVGPATPPANRSDGEAMPHILHHGRVAVNGQFPPGRRTPHTLAVLAQIAADAVEEKLNPFRVGSNAQVNHGQGRRAIHEQRIRVQVEADSFGTQHLRNRAKLLRSDNHIRTCRAVGGHDQGSIDHGNWHDSLQLRGRGHRRAKPVGPDEDILYAPREFKASAVGFDGPGPSRCECRCSPRRGAANRTSAR